MKFCTTCGRTYEDPEIDMCPHDGTPLFGMAGSEGQDLPDEEVDAQEAQATAADISADLPIAVKAETLVEDSDDDIPLPGSTLLKDADESGERSLAEDSEDIPLPGSTLPAFDDASFQDDLFVPPSDPISEQGPDIFDPLGDEPSEEQAEDVFAERERFEDDADISSLLSDDSEAIPEGAPVLGDALFEDTPENDYAIEVPGADDAASIQISEALDTTLGEELEDREPAASASLAHAYEPTSIPIADEDLKPSSSRMADPLQDEGSGGRGGLLVGLLILALVAGAAWYFLLGPGADKPVDPNPVVTTAQDLGTPVVEDLGPAIPDVGAPVDAPDAMADMLADDAALPDIGVDADTVETDKPSGQAPPATKKAEPVKKPVVKRKPRVEAPPKKDPPQTEPAPKDPPSEKTELKEELNDLLE